MTWRKFVLPKCALTHSTFVITERGHIYVWGRNDDGQLGNGSFVNVETPQRLLEQENLTWDDLMDLSCGNYHTGLLYKNGTLKMSGFNAYEQLGIDSRIDKVSSFTEVPFFSQNKISIVQLVCGVFHTAAVTADGSVYTWGHNRHNQLGRPGPVSPGQVDIPAKVVRAYSGAHFLFAETENGDFYAWGMNHDNLLGLKDTKKKKAGERPQIHKKLSQMNKETSPYKLKELVCGGYHYFAVTDAVIYACGWNGQGQLGIGVQNERISRLTPVNSLEAKDIKTLRAGSYYSIAVTKAGKLLGAGSSKEYELGEKSAEPIWYFQPLNHFSHECVSLVCCYSHAVAVTSAGELYQWGILSSAEDLKCPVSLPDKIISLFGMGNVRPPWSAVRLIWIAKMKEPQSTFASLPQEIVKYLIEFL